MTEEDTFNRLKRKSLKVVYGEYRNGDASGLLALYTHMYSNYWTLRDYLEEFTAERGALPERTEKETVDYYMDLYRAQLLRDYGIIIND